MSVVFIRTLVYELIQSAPSPWRPLDGLRSPVTSPEREGRDREQGVERERERQKEKERQN